MSKKKQCREHNCELPLKKMLQSTAKQCQGQVPRTININPTKQVHNILVITKHCCQRWGPVQGRIGFITSTYQRFNVPACQHLNMSTRRRVDVSTLRHVKASALQHVNTSTLRRVDTPTRRRIDPTRRRVGVSTVEALSRRRVNASVYSPFDFAKP